ncbi:MAG: 6-phosphofructokinase [Dehalococcoidia bacterium]|nr:6-phosphofructokinase [Dehalococcoidia bacterium]
MQRIGILTSGGDAPGMNAAIRAAVRTARAKGMSVAGYHDGYTGFVENRYTELTSRSVGNVIQTGGTFLGTSRCKAFLDPKVRAESVAQMREIGVEGLVVIGGDGSFRGALTLESEHNIAVAGIPGTIDNDVWGTEETIGFDTAVNTAMRAIDQLRDTGESTGMMFFVEVMGRTSGAIAMYTALAGGAASVVVPEEDEDWTVIARHIKDQMARGKKSHIIVVAEGEQAGGAFAVAGRLGARLDHEFRVVILGHIQRGGSPTMRDRLVASQSGALAVEALHQDRSGFMVGIQHSTPVLVPLKEAVERGHPEPRMDVLALARHIAG